MSSEAQLTQLSEIIATQETKTLPTTSQFES